MRWSASVRRMSERMRGFPPEPETLVTLADWQDAPNQRWAFRRVRELIPTQLIGAAERPSALPTDLRGADEFGGVGLTRLDGSASTVAEVLADTWTDALLVLRDGRLLVEHYEAGFTAATPHLLMSVTKSVVGCVAATLVADGALAPEDPVQKYVPELADSGYADATLRDVLDMRTGVAFREEYTDPDAEVRVMERSMGWRPLQDGDPVGSYAFLVTLGADGDHGGRFVYRSADTDVLGWVCERAAGVRMADLVTERIWRPIGAEHPADLTCDAVGTGIHDGGMSCTARDLVRFGRLLLDDGTVPAADGGAPARVLPASWLVEARSPDAATLQAFADSDSGPVLPGGWYRNQLWFIPGRHGPLQLCLGIHGQMVYVDRATGTVGVKLSSWPQAQNLPYLLDTVRAFDALAAEL